MTHERFRVVVFSGTESYALQRLVARIEAEVPDVKVCGILYERRRRGKTLPRRVVEFVRNMADVWFLLYAAGRIAHALAAPLRRLQGMGIRLLHAAPACPGRAGEFGLQDLSAFCAARDCSLHVTPDCHASESLEFVRALRPDLGMIYGCRILKPALFEIPRHGSVNIHQRKVPEYRGGGPIGLWELLDGQSEIGVTVHRVAERVDSGAVVNATTIPIGPYDTLRSLALKAHVVGNDLLVRTVADFASGAVKETPQQGQGRTFRNPQPQDLRRYERRIAARGPRYRQNRGRPAWKLLARTLLAMPFVCVRNWVRRARGSFPVVVLYHHLVSDRPHRMGIPTDLFLQHVQFLKEYYRVVSLRDAVMMLKAGRVEVPTVVLTFDDGYGDNYLSLRAIVEATGVPITMFVCPEKIETQHEFEHDIKEGRRGFLPLTWKQLKVLDREGFEIGSHTRSHFDCGTNDPCLLQSEIVGAKVDLEAQLGHDVSLFSFPWGMAQNMSWEARGLAKHTYSEVCSAYGGVNPCSHKPVGHIRRCPHPDNLWELELTLQSILDFGAVSEDEGWTHLTRSGTSTGDEPRVSALRMSTCH
jgi:methionyl-tRNA formyltransferase/peptidoglycan/xylan/chitin deacetylase (PgdA/CDA1 family)